MSEVERRKAANEAVFRKVNERIQRLQHSFAVAEREPLQVVCECDRLDCMARITVGVDVYEHVRSHPDQFLVIAGHEDETVDEVVSVTAGYTIVRKKAGDPREVAVETDPRLEDVEHEAPQVVVRRRDAQREVPAAMRLDREPVVRRLRRSAVVVSTCHAADAPPAGDDHLPDRADVLARFRSGAAGDRERRTELHRRHRDRRARRAPQARLQAPPERRGREDGGRMCSPPILDAGRVPSASSLPALRWRGETRGERRHDTRAPAAAIEHAACGGSCSTHKSPSVSVRHPGWPQTLNMATPETYGNGRPGGNVAVRT